MTGDMDDGRELPEGLEYLLSVIPHYGGQLRESLQRFKGIHELRDTAAAIADIERILVSSATEDDLRRLLIDEWHGQLDPTYRGVTFRSWLSQILGILVER